MRYAIIWMEARDGDGYDLGTRIYDDGSLATVSAEAARALDCFIYQGAGLPDLIERSTEQQPLAVPAGLAAVLLDREQS